MAQKNVSYRSPSYYEVANEKATSWRDFRTPEYRTYRELWENRPRNLDPGSFPLHLDIDLTNACNLKCVMCPRTHFIRTGNRNWAPEGRIGFMEPELFFRVVSQGADQGTYSIKLNYLGEPLMHPRVVDLIRFAHEKGLEVMMNTNATLLTEDLACRLIEAGLDDLFFSVDSPYPREYERIRVGAVFNRVIENIQNFIKVKERLGARHIQTRVSMVLGKDAGGEVRRDFERLFSGLGVAEIGFGLPTEMGVDYWEKYGRIPDFTCRDPYQRLFVFWDGVLGPCCGEWERGYPVGNAWDTPIKKVWHGPEYKRLREAHESGRYQDIPICRACSVPWLSRQEVEG